MIMLVFSLTGCGSSSSTKTPSLQTGQQGMMGTPPEDGGTPPEGSAPPQRERSGNTDNGSNSGSKNSQ